MLRAALPVIRAPLVVASASLALLAACGSGTALPDAARDVVEADRPETDAGPEDAPHADAAPQDDATPVPDGPACDPMGGHVTGSLCTFDLDCACPRACIRLRPAPASGSCWMRCDPAANDPSTGENAGCEAGQTCRAGSGGQGGCLPRGTLLGSLAVPLFEPPSEPASAGDLGMAQVTLEAGLLGTMAFASGWAALLSGSDGPFVRAILYPGDGASVDWDKSLIVDIPADASYVAGASLGLGEEGPVRAEYHERTRVLQAVTRDVLRGEAVGGTLTLSTAGTAAGELVAGDFSVTVLEYESELCGENTAPCE